MTIKTSVEISLHLLGYRKNAGYRKGWYKIIISPDYADGTSIDFEKHSLGLLFCGTDPFALFNEELKNLFLEKDL